MKKCYFDWKYNCSGRSGKLVEAGEKRILTINECSKQYNDNKYIELQSKCEENKDWKLYCHKSCVSMYTDKNKVERQAKRGREETAGQENPSKIRRSNLLPFTFSEHCIFCGKECKIEKDKKHPDRWRPAYLIRQIVHKSEKSIKEHILETCSKRNDDWSSDVRIRVEGAVSDLLAAETRYHVDCRNHFMGARSITAASHEHNDCQPDLDKPFEKVIQLLKSDETQVQNSIEVYKYYKDQGGNKLSRHNLINSLKDHFKLDLLILSSPGYAKLLVFRKKACDILRLAPDKVHDNIDGTVNKLCKHIKQEVRDIIIDKDHYKTHLTKDDVLNETSETFMKLLSSMSPKLDHTPAALLIGNIITAVLSNTTTSLQTAIGVKIRHSKECVQFLHNFQVVCSYDEILRFKKSAAFVAAKDIKVAGVKKNESSFTQVVVDNFDADISSQNGKLSTHSLAMLVAQTNTGPVISEKNQIQEENLISRIKKEDMSKLIPFDPQIVPYDGPRKPSMPEISALTPLLLKVLCRCVLSSKSAQEKDFKFFKDVIFNENIPEYHGYNTRACRHSGEEIKPSTSAKYQPLIDMIPSHPNTMIAALTEAKRLTKLAGQDITVFTCDQQLYRVALQVMWVYPERFSNVVLRLGGMHLLMSFIGSIGALMAESGLQELMQGVFSGVQKMLAGKKFPQNARALRIVVEEVLRSVFERYEHATNKDLMSTLEYLASKSKTTKLWVDCLIKTVFLIIQYVRAEREGNWALHIEAVHHMIPYFYAAGHQNYARYALFYIRSVTTMPKIVLEQFLKGQHVMRHNDGLWNGIWSDMWIETTFMRYGHGLKGIIGITLKPETVKTWALSLHMCTQLEEDVVSISQQVPLQKKIQDRHKEEMKARIEADAKDRKGIQKKLQMLLHPLIPESHPSNLVNIATGKVYPENVNVHDAVSIGSKQMTDFEQGWPTGFYDKIPQKVITMASTKKHINVGNSKVFDTGVIYSRVIGLQASSHNINVDAVLSHELAPVPTSMFNDSGEMRICTSKSKLKTILQECASPQVLSTDSVCYVIDGSALLWNISWPDNSTCQDYLTRFKVALIHRLKIGDVYLIFDRYSTYSTKDITRKNRASGISRIHQINQSSTLPAQKVVLTVTENKKQLIALICQDILRNTDLLTPYTQNKKLIVTGQDEVPNEVCGPTIIERHDLANNNEEADVIIAQQAMKSGIEGKYTQVNVIADDTDVFLLLLHHYHEQKSCFKMFMESPIQGRNVIDIAATVKKHSNIIPDLLAAHAISGCDTTATHYGIGKTKIVKILQRGYSLSLMGDEAAHISDINKQASVFINACYGQPKCISTSEARINSWCTKMGQNRYQPPRLSSLPPTSEAFLQNVKRSHLQTCVWKNALRHHSLLDPLNFGYYKNIASKCLLPVTVPDNIPLAPDEILKLVKCSCVNEAPCHTNRCRCVRGGLPCAMFCNCKNNGCLNRFNNDVPEEDDDVEEN